MSTYICGFKLKQIFGRINIFVNIIPIYLNIIILATHCYAPQIVWEKENNPIIVFQVSKTKLFKILNYHSIFRFVVNYGLSKI